MNVTKEFLDDLSEEQFAMLLALIQDEELISDITLFVAGVLPASSIEISTEIIEQIT